MLSRTAYGPACFIRGEERAVVGTVGTDLMIKRPRQTLRALVAPGRRRQRPSSRTGIAGYSGRFSKNGTSIVDVFSNLALSGLRLSIPALASSTRWVTSRLLLVCGLAWVVMAVLLGLRCVYLCGWAAPAWVSRCLPGFRVACVLLCVAVAVFEDVVWARGPFLLG